MHTRTITTRTLRIPRSPAAAGDGAAVARQMDAVLAGAGFKATRDLLEHVSGLEPGAAMDLAVDVVAAVRELVGDHVAHDPYFRDFPRGVPDTVEFWVRCLRDALVAPRARGAASAPTDGELLAVLDHGLVGLLDLPRYGRYQHTYAELLAAHDESGIPVRSARLSGNAHLVYGLRTGAHRGAGVAAVYFDNRRSGGQLSVVARRRRPAVLEDEQAELDLDVAIVLLFDRLKRSEGEDREYCHQNDHACGNTRHCAF
ncbi:hypothetical protein AB0F52_14990 [Amycolatopsis sp. NPDC024027]|uniref:hypothetical protein n=1 Tax=Amycolatopsis sp. NPDC024027 TaxID=3154327 RepID=UPI0033E4B2B7